MIVGLFTGIILARLLGPDDRGVLGSIVTYATVLVGLGQLSVGDVTVIQEKELGEDQALATAWTISIANFCISTPILTAIIWALFRTDEDVPMVLTVAFFVAFAVSTMINQLYLGVFRIRHEFGRVQMYSLTKPVIYLAFLLVLASGLAAPTVQMALIALIASNLFAVAARAVIDGLPFVGQLHWKSTKPFLKLALPLYTTKVVQTLATQGDRLLAVALLSKYEIGIFLVASTFASVIPGVYSTAVKLLVLPVMISINHEKRSAQASQMLRLTWAASIVAGLFTAALADVLIPLMFGTAYASAGGLAMWLAVANLLRPVRESLLEIQKSYAVTKFFALPSLVLFITFVAVTAALFPILGVYGVIAGSGISELVTVVMLSYRLKQYAPEFSISRWILPRGRDFTMLISYPWDAIFNKGKKS